jgi:hypothetical protein
MPLLQPVMMTILFSEDAITLNSTFEIIHSVCCLCLLYTFRKEICGSHANVYRPYTTWALRGVPHFRCKARSNRAICATQLNSRPTRSLPVRAQSKWGRPPKLEAYGMGSQEMRWLSRIPEVGHDTI